jgi:hypothetical protein
LRVLSILLLSGTAALGAGEALLRWRGAFRPEPITYVGEVPDGEPELYRKDARLGWRMRPSAGEVHAFGHGVSYGFNAQGFRHPADFDPDETRAKIVVVGDSYAFGWGVEYEDTFAARIGSALAGTVVYDLAIPGFGVDQMWLTLRHVGLPVQPELAVVVLFAGDFRRSQRAYRYGVDLNKPVYALVDGELVPKTAEDRPPALLRWLDRHSHLYAGFQTAKRWLGFRLPVGEFWHLNRALLDALREDCRAAGVPVLFVYVPYTSWKSFPTLRRYMEATGASFLDLSVVAPSHPRDAFLGDGHLSPRGHALLADAVLRWLDEHPLVRGADATPR